MNFRFDTADAMSACVVSLNNRVALIAENQGRYSEHTRKDLSRIQARHADTSSMDVDVSTWSA